VGTLQPAHNGVSAGVAGPSTITINSNPNGGFVNAFGPFGTGNPMNRTLTILHEMGHAVANSGGATEIVGNDKEIPHLSTQNNETVAADCFQ
jgi:hypothetical protein